MFSTSDPQPATGNPFFVAGGNLEPNAPCYVERAADRELFAALLRGEFCYVLDARQVGKSSLRVRTAARLQEAGVAVAQIDLTSLGTTSNTIEQWYYGLLVRIGRQLRLEDELDAFWTGHERMGPLHRWVAALQAVVLSRGERLVLLIDEIDCLRQTPFLKDEFLAAVRSCYDRRTIEPEFARLTFCLLGTAAPSDLIRDPRATPFNIGRRIELTDFTVTEAEPLAFGFAESLATENTESTGRTATLLLRRVIFWTGGHPYLTQRLCRAICDTRNPASSSTPSPSLSVTSVLSVAKIREPTVDAMCEAEYLAREPRDVDHLEIVSRRLLESAGDRAALLTLYGQVHRAGAVEDRSSGSGRRFWGGMAGRWYRRLLRGDGPIPDDDTNPLIGTLQLSGLVREVEGELRVRNRIYERVFDGEWIAEQMPDAEVRRQRAAERRGRRQATVRVGVVALLCAGWAVTAMVETGSTRRALHSSYLAQARALRLTGRPGQRVESLALIEKAARMRPSLELRNEAIAAMALIDVQMAAEWPDDPPGSTIGFADSRFERYIGRGPGEEISIRRIGDGREVMRFPGSGARLYWGAFSPNNRFLGIKDMPNRLMVWDLERRRRIIDMPDGAWEETICFSADGAWCASSDKNGQLTLYSLPDGRPRRQIGLGLVPKYATFSPDSTRLAVCSRSGQLHLWRVGDARRQWALTAPDGIYMLAWYPDGKQLAAACGDGQVYLYEADSGRRVTQVAAHRSRVSGVGIAPGGELLLSGGWDGISRIWDARTWDPLFTITGKAGVTLDRTGTLTGPSIHHQAVRTWRLIPNRERRTLAGAETAGWCCSVSPNGRWVATGGLAGFGLWDLDSGRIILRRTDISARSVQFHPSGRSLITSGPEGVLVRELEQGLPGTTVGPTLGRPRPIRLADRPGHRCPGRSSLADLSSDGRWLAVIQEQGDTEHVHVVDLEHSSPQVVLPVGSQSRRRMAISPDGRWVAMGSWQGSDGGGVEVWDVAARRRVRRLASGNVSAAFSPDGVWLVTGTGEDYRFWRVGEWSPGLRIPRIDVHNIPGEMVFSPDGRTIAVADARAVIRLINLSSGRELATLEAPQREKAPRFFTPDGGRLATVDVAGSVYLWDLRLIRQRLARMGLDW